LVDQYLSLLANRLDAPATPPAAFQAAIDSLSVLSSTLDHDRLVFVSQSLLSILHGATSSSEPRVIGMLRAMHCWLMALPTGFLEAHEPVNKQLMDVLLSCLERGNETGRAAELLLIHLLHQLDNEPSREPALVTDVELRLALGGDAVYELGQGPDGVTITCSDPHGANTWRFAPLTGKCPERTCDQLDLSHAVPQAYIEPYSRTPFGRAIPQGELPLYTLDVSLEQTDMLASMLRYLDSEFPECKEATCGPEYASPDRREAVAEIRKACAAVVKAEEALAQQCREMTKTMKTAESRYAHRRAKPSEAPRLPSRFHQGRLLLSQLGLLTARQKKGFPVGVLAPTKGVTSALGDLSDVPSRHQHHLSLHYHSDSEFSCRDSFDDFARALGASDCGHIRYKGPAYEAVFHTDKSPYPVQIVWNDTPEYDPTSSGSSFQLVITPKPTDGFYAIHLRIDARYPKSSTAVGPLFDGALVPRALLPALVRATAIAADRLLTVDAQVMHFSQADDRQRAIKDLVAKQTLSNWTPAQVLSHVLLPPDSNMSGLHSTALSPVVI